MVTDVPKHRPLLLPLGDSALLVRFADRLSDGANRAALAFARSLEQDPPPGVTEIDPNLVSVLVRYDSALIDPATLAGQLRLSWNVAEGAGLEQGTEHRIVVSYGGEGGPDLDDVAVALKMSTSAFVRAHTRLPLRVLTIGFAPGFAYCGFHPDRMHLPRRSTVRPPVPPGSILFAAGQTAIAATSVPTGWHVIGRTPFRNFNPDAEPPTQLREGDTVRFEAVKA